MPTETEIRLAKAAVQRWFPPYPTVEDEIREHLATGNEVNWEMQTFLPYPDFTMSARCLDNKRLGKQRIEAMQILNTLHGTSARGWPHHPATRMWEGHAGFLQRYYNEMVKEWIFRGFNHTPTWGHVLLTPHTPETLIPEYRYLELGVWPPWLGMPEFHASHRAALLAKLPEHYSQFGWTEEPKIEYFWPVQR